MCVCVRVGVCLGVCVCERVFKWSYKVRVPLRRDNELSSRHIDHCVIKTLSELSTRLIYTNHDISHCRCAIL